MKKKDEGFTSIRIRETTREALRAVGTYNDNMDSIVMKCLNAYKKLSGTTQEVNTDGDLEKIIQDQLKGLENDLEAIKRGKGIFTSLLQQKAIEEQIEIMKRRLESRNIFNNAIVSSLSKGEAEVKLWMPGLKFPTNKTKLLQFAKELQEKRGTQIQLTLVERLPDNKTYTDAFQLEEDIVEVSNNYPELMNKAKEQNINKIVGCAISVEEDENKLSQWVEWQSKTVK